MSNKNNKFKKFAPLWKRELPDGAFSVSHIQDCYGYIIKEHEIVTDNPSLTIYVDKIKNGITFKIKTRYCF